MPCDQVVKFNVKFDLERQGNMDRYLKAAEALNWIVYGKWRMAFLLSISGDELLDSMMER